MRIGLISALRRSKGGDPRAELTLAGRSVLAWQVALLRTLGVERVICLADSAASPAILSVQHDVEADGVAFHLLRGFAALPALVRAEDDLVIIADGLLPDPAAVKAVLGGEGAMRRVVAAMPADHALAAEYPEDFERIDAGRHWSGVLAMRGAAVQHLSDFPEDADAISLLLRLALQAGTPCGDMTPRELVPERWLLAHSFEALELQQQSLIAHAAADADWRAPFTALAGRMVRALAPRGLDQGGVIAGSAALLLALGGTMAAALGLSATALALAGLGAFVARVSQTYNTLAARLRRTAENKRGGALLEAAVDVLAGVALWFALSPWPAWQPLAALGPVLVGLARLVAQGTDGALAALASDRVSLLLALALSAAFGVLPTASACLALGLLAALLLRARAT